MTATRMIIAREAAAGAGESRPALTRLDLAYLAYLYAARFAARALPPRVFMTVCHAIARLAARCLAGSRSRVAASLRATFPETPEHQVAAWAGAAVEGFLVRAAQDLVTTRLVAGGHLKDVTVAGIEHLETARAAGRGVVVCSGHFLAVRLARCWLASQGIAMRSTRKAIPPTRAVGRWGQRVLQPAYERFMHDVVGTEILVAERGSTLRMLRHLREGGILYAHLDTRFSSRVVEYPLLGQRKKAGAAGLLEVAHLTRAPLVPVEFAGDWRRLRIEFFAPLVLVDAPDRESFVVRNLPLVIASLEELIKRQPEQWEYWVLGWPGELERDVWSR